MVRIIIAGSRDFDNYPLLEKTVTEAFQQIPNLTRQSTIIVSGGAEGVDKLGEYFADNNGLKKEIYPANWDAYGNAAGPIRNQKMAEVSDILIAFYNGHSKGTSNMIQQAQKHGLAVKVVNY